MKDCEYPRCTECHYDDCIMNDDKDIHALLRRRYYHKDLEQSRERQRTYRKRIKDYFPHCDECKNCIYVKKAKGETITRLCTKEMRLVESKVSNSPLWCLKRKRDPKEREKYERRKERRKIRSVDQIADRKGLHESDGLLARSSIATYNPWCDR